MNPATKKPWELALSCNFQLTATNQAKRALNEMAFAVRAISQGTSCSQPCVPRATKAFLFKPSENSPSCPFTQEHSEPPVAIVVKVFCSHRGPASSKEPQSPHSGIVSPLTHSSHRTHSTDFNSGPFFSRHMGPIPAQVCTHWLCG